MKDTKKIQFLPGLGEKPGRYKDLQKFFEVLDIDWNTGKIKPKIKAENILVGFSMGAILACEYTFKNKVKTLILCSLTPGGDTLEHVRADEVILLAGDKERWIIKEIKRIRKTLRCKNSLILIPKAGHRITRNYRERLLEIIKNKNNE